MTNSEIINDNINDNINDGVNDGVKNTENIETENTNNSEQNIMTLEELDTFVGNRIAEALNTYSQYVQDSLTPLIELVDDIALDAFFARSILTQDEKIKAIYEDIKATNKSVEDVSSEENEQTENVENESVEEVPDNVDIQTES